MHKIAEKEFTLEDFSHEHLSDISMGGFKKQIEYLECLRTAYISAKDEIKYAGMNKKDLWRQMIQLLPSSYNQTRNVMLNYEVLANIYKSRRDHKLDEWREFCKWIASLPYSELIIMEKTFGCLLPMLEPGYAYTRTKCINQYVGPISKTSKDDSAEMTEMPDDTDRDTLPKKAIFGSPMGQGGKYDI